MWVSPFVLELSAAHAHHSSYSPFTASSDATKAGVDFKYWQKFMELTNSMYSLNLGKCS